jgi:hypothetical protein
LEGVIQIVGRVSRHLRLVTGQTIQFCHFFTQKDFGSWFAESFMQLLLAIGNKNF